MGGCRCRGVRGKGEITAGNSNLRMKWMWMIPEQE